MKALIVALTLLFSVNAYTGEDCEQGVDPKGECLPLEQEDNQKKQDDSEEVFLKYLPIINMIIDLVV